MINVAKVEDIPPGAMREARLAGRPIVVANLGDRFVAFQNSCLHYQVRLSEGRLEGDVLTCRWHQWQYCVRTGEVLTSESPYATMVTFPVVECDGDVLVAPKPATLVAPRGEPPSA